MDDAMTPSDSETANVVPLETEEDPQAKFIDAAARVAAGESVVVIAEVADGSASQLVGLLPEEVTLFSRATCAAADRATVGGVAQALDIEDFPGGALILDDAQWADPTSLGRLQRLVKDGPHPFLLVIAHRPASEIEGLLIDELAGAARRHASLVEIRLAAEEDVASAEELEPQAVDLIVAANLVTAPISVPIAARFLELGEPELFEVADALVERGLLGQARGGYRSAPGSPAPEVGDAHIGYIAGRLANAMEEAGEAPGLIGALRLSAGEPDEAYTLLGRAAHDSERRHATGEAFHLAEAALRAAEEAGVADGAALGELHLICGRFLRSAGRSSWAADHLEKATSRLEGPERVEALALAAAVADDAQRPQEAERIVAVAEWEAIRHRDEASLGSLLALRARVLNRIGFAEEADAALSKGKALLKADASPTQRFEATVNKAGIHFDRGEAELAEVEFTQLRDQAGPLEGDATVAEMEAWRARALFAAGYPGDALQAVGVAEELAMREEVEAPIFLAQLALSEGNLAFGRGEDALDAAEVALELVERQLPAWENMARSHRASAYLRLGRIDEAREEIGKALEVTPPGANGWRWRLRCRALQMEIAARAGERWPEKEAEDLADLMLHSRLYGWAAELLSAIAEHGRRKGAAAEALGLAAHIGLPMVAARAAQAGSLWKDPAAAHVIFTIRAIEDRIPSAWEDDWRAMPAVKEALAAPEPADEEAFEAATAAMEDALARAGLADTDVVLSPAQRRGKGLVRRPRISPLRLLAATIGTVVVAGGVALLVVLLTQPEPPPPEATPTTEVTVTLPPALEETLLAVPSDIEFFFGTSEHRGDVGRSGVVESQGPTEVAGYFWKVRTAGSIEAAPIAWGKNVYVGTTEGTFYALDQTSGDERWTMTPEGRIFTAPAMGMVGLGEGQFRMIMVIVDDAGVVRGHDAASDVAATWSRELGSRIRSSPVVVEEQELAIVATSEGFIHGLRLFTGEDVWRYPEGDVGVGTVTADLAYHDGVLYVGTEEGILHVIDVGSPIPELVCEFDARGEIASNPMIVDQVVYVPTLGHNIWTLPLGACDGSVPNRDHVYVTDTPVDVAPAIIGDIMYIPDGRYLYARNLATNDHLWTPGSVAAERPISAPPIVAGDAVYFASVDGVVHAADVTTGETLWTWRTGLHVRGSPAVVDGVVFIVSGDGFIYAVGANP